MARALTLLYGLTALACVSPSPPSTALYSNPFPDERMRRPDGTIEVRSFPWGTGAPLRAQILDALEGADGFGVSAAILFPFDEALDPTTLPSLDESIRPGASVALVDVDSGSPEFGRHLPLDVRSLADAGPFGGTHLLVALPLPGVTLAPDTLYAAVVTTDARTARGEALEPTDDLGSTDAHAEARSALARLGVDADRIAALAVLRTGDPTRELALAVATARRDLAGFEVTPQLTEEHTEYCVYETTIAMPVYQRGEPPYLLEGGEWAREAGGRHALQRREIARVWITVPRRDDTHPPAAVFVRAGGGGDRPLIDRGPADAPGQWTAGRGPAVELAHAGWVGVSVDGPLGGARNLDGWDEQMTVFNVLNLRALRDTVRQSALELALLPHALEGVALDTRDCTGAAPRTVLASDELALIAHSTGATIAPLAAAVQPRYRALVLSGAGASWVRQVMYKESPVPSRPLAEHLLGYTGRRGVSLHEHDPILAMLSWGGEVADPIAYARALDPSVHVLVFQGVRDTYIPPPIANPVALAFELDLAGSALDAESERPVLDDLRAIDRGQWEPASELDGRGLRVLVQHPEDGIEDGHEVLYQLPAARRQLRCFLETLRAGAPTVVADDPAAEGCSR